MTRQLLPEKRTGTERNEVGLNWLGKEERRVVVPAELPFQVLERLGGNGQLHLPEGGWPEGWENRLIWGDNALIAGSLRHELKGAIDLIYVDPPFDTGADYNVHIAVGNGSAPKQRSLWEERAYYDTWGRAGLDSFLQMLYERFLLMRDLLSKNGTIYVHMGWNVAHLVRAVMDEVFSGGQWQFINELIWKRQTAHSDTGQGAKHMGRLHDTILVYGRGNYAWNMQYTPYDQEYIDSFYNLVDEQTGRRYQLGDLTAPGGAGKGNPFYAVMGVERFWRYSEKEMKRLIKEGRVVQLKPGSVPRLKRYLDEMPGVPLQDVWTDIRPVQSQAQERTGYETQKPEALLERIIMLSSNPGALVADFFCGSGTTAAVAEKLGRRWIAADLSPFAIHVTRKRMLSIPHVRPFVIQSLGRYPRHYFLEGIVAEEEIAKREADYIAFVLNLYHADPVEGYVTIHGRKGDAWVHVSGLDGPPTVDSVRDFATEIQEANGNEGHILVWEVPPGWVDQVHNVGNQMGLTLRPRQIPTTEVLQKRVEDVTFYDLPLLEVQVAAVADRPCTVRVALGRYIPFNVPGELAAKIATPTDLIDYWAIDFDHREQPAFVNCWESYRTIYDASLELETTHTYETPGTYRIAVKVVDVFGNETTKHYQVEVQ